MIRNRITGFDAGTMSAIPAYVAQERAERIAADADLQAQIDAGGGGSAPVLVNGIAHMPDSAGDTIYFPASTINPDA